MSPDNDFGKDVLPGIFRRRVRITGVNGQVSADVEDDNHRFGADIEHNGETVTAVHGRALRTPWTTCPLAIAQLQVLVGTPLLSSPFAVLRQTKLADHCTHLVDMAALAIAAAARHLTARQYDAAIRVGNGLNGDWRNGLLTRDGATISRWALNDGLIREPFAFAGLEMRRAASWVADHTGDADMIEEVFFIQRAMLVAGGMRHVLDDNARPSAHGWMTGACFAFQPSRIKEGRRRVGSTVAFDDPDQLLRDLDQPL